MTKTVLLATAALLALSVGGVASASTAKAPVARIHTQFTAVKHNIAPKKSKVLYNQNSNDTGDAIDSQMFGSSFPTYDSYGADDFQLKKAGKAKGILVTGQYFNGPGPATSANVIFYNDNSGVPGTVLATYSKVKLGGTGADFELKLKPALKLAAKTTYWVTVQAVEDYDNQAIGEWGWEVSSVQHGNAAEWQNPGGGFAVCPTWGTIETCLGATGPDLMFELLK
jgi:hypothetical protein